jgi:hypothetical protein
MKTISPKKKSPPKFNILRNTLATVITVIFLSGCSNYWVLRADFDNYSPNIISNESLEGPIKGNPEGDLIELTCPTGDIDILSGNPNVLRIDNCFEFLFIPAEHSSPSGYKIDWVGKRDNASGSGLTFITFTDDSNPFESFFFRFKSGTLEIVRKINQDVLATVVVHDFATHSIEIEMNMDNNTIVNFLFKEKFGDGTSGPQISHSFELPNFKKLTAIRIDTQQLAPYEISDLDIYALN